MRDLADALNCAHLWGSREALKVTKNRRRSAAGNLSSAVTGENTAIDMLLVTPSFAVCWPSPALQLLLLQTLDLTLPAMQTGWQEMDHSGLKAA